MYYITINVQYVRYSTGRKIKYFIVYRSNIVDAWIKIRINSNGKHVWYRYPVQYSGYGTGTQHLKTVYNEVFCDFIWLDIIRWR